MNIKKLIAPLTLLCILGTMQTQILSNDNDCEPTEAEEMFDALDSAINTLPSELRKRLNSHMNEDPFRETSKLLSSECKEKTDSETSKIKAKRIARQKAKLAKKFAHLTTKTTLTAVIKYYGHKAFELAEQEQKLIETLDPELQKNYYEYMAEVQKELEEQSIESSELSKLLASKRDEFFKKHKKPSLIKEFKKLDNEVMELKKSSNKFFETLKPYIN